MFQLSSWNFLWFPDGYLIRNKSHPKILIQGQKSEEEKAWFLPFNMAALYVSPELLKVAKGNDTVTDPSHLLFFYNVFFFHSCWTHCFWGAKYHPICCNEVSAKKPPNMLATPRWGLRHPFPTWWFQQMQPLKWSLCFINSKYYWEYEGDLKKKVFSLLRTDSVYLYVPMPCTSLCGGVPPARMNGFCLLPFSLSVELICSTKSYLSRWRCAIHILYNNSKEM